MSRQDPYSVIKSRYVTEKTQMLLELTEERKNRSAQQLKCNKPKYVFIVDREATKPQIANAVRDIYSNDNNKIKVVSVNTINTKEKPKRRGKGRQGASASFKKAIVTLEPGDSLDNI